MLRVVASRGVIIALRRMQSMLLSCSKYPWKYVKIAFALVECCVITNHLIMLGVESNWNSFKICSFQKFAIRLIRKGKKYSKFDENLFELHLFD